MRKSRNQQIKDIKPKQTKCNKVHISRTARPLLNCHAGFSTVCSLPVSVHSSQKVTCLIKVPNIKKNSRIASASNSLFLQN